MLFHILQVKVFQELVLQVDSILPCVYVCKIALKCYFFSYAVTRASFFLALLSLNVFQDGKTYLSVLPSLLKILRMLIQSSAKQFNFESTTQRNWFIKMFKRIGSSTDHYGIPIDTSRFICTSSDCITSRAAFWVRLRVRCSLSIRTVVHTDLVYGIIW